MIIDLLVSEVDAKTALVIEGVLTLVLGFAAYNIAVDHIADQNCQQGYVNWQKEEGRYDLLQRVETSADTERLAYHYAAYQHACEAAGGTYPVSVSATVKTLANRDDIKQKAALDWQASHGWLGLEKVKTQ